MLPTESDLSPESPCNSDLVPLATSSTLAPIAPEVSLHNALDSKNTIPIILNVASPAHIKEAYNNATIPDDLSAYPKELEAFSRFVAKLRDNIRATGGEISSNDDSAKQQRTSAATVPAGIANYSSDSLVRYYTGETGPAAIIPKLESVVPISVNGIRAPLFYPRILNSISWTLEHPRRRIGTKPEEALGNFIDSWAASRSSLGIESSPLPSAYCLMEAQGVDTIPNVYGNSATPLRENTRQMLSLEEWVLEHTYHRVVGFPDYSGRSPASQVKEWSSDHCAELITWGYIEGYVKAFIESNKETTLVITSLTMMKGDKRKRGFCKNCRSRASDWVRKYPRLRLIDLGATPNVTYEYQAET